MCVLKDRCHSESLTGICVLGQHHGLGCPLARHPISIALRVGCVCVWFMCVCLLLCVKDLLKVRGQICPFRKLK